MLAFFGTSSHSAKFLELIIKEGLKPDLVVSAPPKPVGKKQILTENPTVTVAKKENLPVILDLGNLSDLGNLGDLTFGLMLDFNKIIPIEVINLFEKGIINIHFSKLPEYRGPAPVSSTILNGDQDAWITYFLIDEKVDHGPILSQTSLPLTMTETKEILYQKLIEKSAGEISLIIDNYLHDRVHPCQQTGTPTYSHKFTAETCKIDWKKSSAEIERLVRAASPEPGAWTTVEVQRDKGTEVQKLQRLKILKAHLENSKLVFDVVQLEGKKPVTWKQFLEGHPEAEISNF